MYYQRRELLALLVGLLALASGEQYSLTVSDVELNENGICHKMVTVSGNGVEDKVPVRCDMTGYSLADHKLLLVGDKLFSDKADTLMVLGTQGCQQRTYSGGLLVNVQELTDDYCVDIKLQMMKAYMESLGLSSSEEDGTDAVKSGDKQGQANADEELHQWIEENVNKESDDGVVTISQDDDKDDERLW